MGICGWLKGFGVIVCCIIGFNDCSTAQITPDATLPNNSSIRRQNDIRVIEGGTQAGNNLFHSFKEFSVPNGTSVYFNNDFIIQNIITRVTGTSISNIDGAIKAKGSANLFLINPNGIIFGNNASLNIGGSFVASTASSVNFGDGTKFSTIEPTTLLTVSVPIGLQFGTTAYPIINQSQLEVLREKTLALVGGDVTLEGGKLIADGGLIDVLSVAPNNLVSLQPTSQGWKISYNNVQNFQDIQLKARIAEADTVSSAIDVSAEGGGNIQLAGRRLLITNGYIYAHTPDEKPGGDIIVNATESVEIGERGSLFTGTKGVGNSGNIIINTSKLIVRDSGQLIVFNSGSGSGGELTVNASDSVEISGGIGFNNFFIASGLYSATYGAGNAANITINTGKLMIQGGGKISTQSEGILSSSNRQLIPATGRGGNLIVNALESIDITGKNTSGSAVSSLLAGTEGLGDAGNLFLNTNKLVVRDGARVAVGSQFRKDVNYIGDARNLGSAGALEVRANSIILDNQGKLVSQTDLGKGGNISLQVQKLLLLRRNSQISTSAGELQAVGDGGNIYINAYNGFIVAEPFENSDITANAFKGSGGKVSVNAAGIFGIVQRSRNDLEKLLTTKDANELDPQNLPTSDITAFSQTNPILNGQVSINTFDVDPNRGLFQISTEPSQPKLTQSCLAPTGQRINKFTITGRRGLPANPNDYLINYNIYTDWISTPPDTENIKNIHQNTHLTPNQLPTPVIEAQGWIIDADGNTVLVAQAPTNHNSSLNHLSYVPRLKCAP